MIWYIMHFDNIPFPAKWNYFSNGKWYSSDPVNRSVLLRLATATAVAAAAADGASVSVSDNESCSGWHFLREGIGLTPAFPIDLNQWSWFICVAFGLPSLGLVVGEPDGDLFGPFPCFFFTAWRHFIRAFDVCSSNMDFFICDPIWISSTTRV